MVYASDKAVIYQHSIDVSANIVSMIFSKEIAKYIVSSISKSEEIEINFSKSHIVIQLEGHSISAILSNVNQPPFQKLFDTIKPTNVLKFDRESLYASVKRLSQISDDSFRVLVFDVSKKTLGISFENVGTKLSAKEILDCDFNGEDLKIGFKADYLLNIMNSLSFETEITMQLTSAEKPCLLSAPNINIILAPIKL